MPHHLTHGSLSADGSRVVAAWRVPPRNRAGTDGSSAVGAWDLGTGDAVVLPGATGPVALSPDGATMMAMLPPQDAQPGRSRRVEPVLLRFGQTEPFQRLALPDAGTSETAATDPSLVAAAFDPSARWLLAVSASGALLRWDLAQPGPAQPLDGLPAGVGQEPIGRAGLGFDATGTQLVLVVTAFDVDPDQPRAFVASWQVDLAAGRAQRQRAEQANVHGGVPAGLAASPLVLVPRTSTATTVTTSPTGEQSTRTTRWPRLEPGFVGPDRTLRVVNDDSGTIVVESEQRLAYVLEPGKPARAIARAP